MFFLSLTSGAFLDIFSSFSIAKCDGLVLVVLPDDLLPFYCLYLV